MPAWVAALGAFIVVAAIGVIAWLRFRKRPSPEEVERLRRLDLHRTGKMGDGQIVDVEGATIVYTYSIAGVIYTASQDAAGLQQKLPEDRMTMVGPVMIKFDPRNPANSIVLCEEWSGLRKRIPQSKV